MATIFDNEKQVITAGDMKVGQVFKTVGYTGEGWYIRIQPSAGVMTVPKDEIVVLMTRKGVFNLIKRCHAVIPAVSVTLEITE